MNQTNALLIVKKISIMTLFLSLSSCDQFEPPIKNGKPESSAEVPKSPRQSNQEELFPKKENEKNFPPVTLPADPTSKKVPSKKPQKKRKPLITELPVDNPIILPIDHIITDSSGRKLNAIITARYENEIAVIRKKDSKAFDLPISKLSQSDLDFVSKLPITEKPEKVAPYIVKCEKQIEQYTKDILKLREKLASGTLNTSQMRGNTKEQARVDAKIQDLKKQIQERSQKRKN